VRDCIGETYPIFTHGDKSDKPTAGFLRCNLLD
jgi:hypothetical protein